MFAASFLSSCEKINEANIAEYKVLCSEYGYVPNSSDFTKCVKRQSIVAKYENKSWFSRSLSR